MTMRGDAVAGPLQGQEPLAAGAPLSAARAALLMLHGRGASARDILSFTDEVAQHDIAYLAPQAAGNAWYPNSFLADVASNEPYLSASLAMIDSLLDQIAASGVPLERVVILGFSQGACLAAEYVVRHARRYGGVVGWSGGLIGPDGTAWEYGGSLGGTPVFLGCSADDPHIPRARVDRTAAIFRNLGGDVTERIYPNMGHTVNQDEIAFTRAMLATLR